jgi:Uncharacterised nucleotidyltransferase
MMNASFALVSAPEHEKTAKLAAAAFRLRLDAALASVSEEFERRGINALVLKGPSIAQWLYSEEERRPYNDCDLLLAPGHVELAAETLEAMGYQRSFDDRGMPEWWREHGTALVRGTDGVTFDLHRRLPGVRASEHRAWVALSRDPASISVAGREVPALGAPGRTMNLALHAAHHGADWAGATDDMQRGLEQLDCEVWRQAHLLATETKATEAFAAGLRLTPEGTRMAQILGLPEPCSVETTLRAATPPPVALGLQQVTEANGYVARLTILMRKAVPPAAFIRHWDPRATESRKALTLAYARRPLWLLARAPAGFRAWRTARKSTRGR